MLIHAPQAICRTAKDRPGGKVQRLMAAQVREGDLLRCVARFPRRPHLGFSWLLIRLAGDGNVAHDVEWDVSASEHQPGGDRFHLVKVHQSRDVNDVGLHLQSGSKCGGEVIEDGLFKTVRCRAR